MADYAVMPYTDYEDACNAVREKTGGTEVIKSGEMGAQIRAIDTQEDLSPELTEQDTLIADIMTALEGKSAASGAEVVTGVYNLETTSYPSTITIPGLIGKKRFCIAHCDDFNVVTLMDLYGIVLHCQKLSEENSFRIQSGYGGETGGCSVLSSPTWDSLTGTLTFNSVPNYKLLPGDWFYIGW